MDLPLLCVPAHEAQRYRNALPYAADNIVAVPDDVVGIAQTRKWIVFTLTEERNERYVLMLDDDMDFCFRPDSNKPKLEMIQTRERMEDMLSILEQWLKDGFIHVGLSSRQGNNRLMQPYRDATRMMNAYAYDVEALRSTGVEVGRVLMDDFDVTLQLLRKGYPNRVSLNYCWNQRSSGASGGCSSYRTPQYQSDEAHRLAEFHPDFIKIKIKRNKDSSGSWKGMKERVDVDIEWRKAYASSGEKPIEGLGA